MKTVVPATWNIPSQIRERFGETGGRQRAMAAEGHLLLVLHEPPTPDNRNRNARIFWRDPTGVWNSNTKGGGIHSLKKHLAEFSERVEQLERSLLNASGADDYFQLLQAVAPLHRTCRNLHVTLQQARDLMPDERDFIVLRDAAGDLERAFELVHLDAKNGLEYTVARRAELQSQRTYEMAVSAHRLNLLAALFFPITALSAVFGMNLSSGIDALQGPGMFWLILLAGFLSGLCLFTLIAQKPQPAKGELSDPSERNKDRRSARNVKKLHAQPSK